MSLNEIVVRHMQFDLPEVIDLDYLQGRPEESCFNIALSLLLPYLEPYLIRTMKAAKPHVRDPKLLEQMAAFSAQEGQHYRQHIRFNERLRAQGLPKLKQLEAELQADYERFSNEKSLRFNLAYAEGFEALTTATARATFEEREERFPNNAVGELFLWHTLEELEHRTVAFDVFDHVCGDYGYRLIWGTYAQWHMLRWLIQVAEYLLAASPEIVERHGGAAGRKRRERSELKKLTRTLLPKVLHTFLPSYTPHDIELTREMQALADHFSTRAVRLPRATSL